MEKRGRKERREWNVEWKFCIVVDSTVPEPPLRSCEGNSLKETLTTALARVLRHKFHMVLIAPTVSSKLLRRLRILGKQKSMEIRLCQFMMKTRPEPRSFGAQARVLDTTSGAAPQVFPPGNSI